MADFVPTRPVKDELSSTGAQIRIYRMAGDAGAGANGISEWRDVQKVQDMTFMLYPAGPDQQGDISAAVVEIQASLENDVDNPETETDYVVIATLDNTTRIASFAGNLQNVRIEMTTPGAVAAQVGMQTFGI